MGKCFIWVHGLILNLQLPFQHKLLFSLILLTFFVSCSKQEHHLHVTVVSTVCYISLTYIVGSSCQTCNIPFTVRCKSLVGFRFDCSNPNRIQMSICNAMVIVTYFIYHLMTKYVIVAYSACVSQMNMFLVLFCFFHVLNTFPEQNIKQFSKIYFTPLITRSV